MPGTATVPRHAQADPTARRSGAASACSPASGACACRCPGRACRTATPGRSRPATASCSSTRGMHEPGSHAPTSSARWSRSASQLEHVRLLVCTHAHADHCGQARADRGARRLRAVDAPRPRAHHRAAPTTPRRRSRGGSRCARQSGVPEEPLRAWARAPARPGHRHARAVAPDRDLLPRASRSRPTSARGSVHETPGHAPSHVVPVPARAAAADLRRPPARPRLALLRLRLHARPGRRVPGLARPRRGARRAAAPGGPRAPVHRRARPRRRPTARWSRERLDARAARRSRARPRRPPSSCCPRSTGTSSTPTRRAGC